MPPRRTSRRRVAPLRDMALVAKRPSGRTGDKTIHAGLDIGGSSDYRLGLATTSAEAGNEPVLQFGGRGIGVPRAKRVHISGTANGAEVAIPRIEDVAAEGRPRRACAGLAVRISVGRSGSGRRVSYRPTPSRLRFYSPLPRCSPEPTPRSFASAARSRKPVVV